MKNKFVLLGIAVVSAVLLITVIVSAKQLDVIGNGSVTSFEEVLNTIPDNIEADEMNSGWSLTAPDGSARFIWSKDFSKSPLYDAMLELDAKPFIDAGLDITKLPDEMINEDKIIVGTTLGKEALSYNGDVTPLSSYEQIVNLKRGTIGYHANLDHFGVDLTDGNMFEWAKDMRINDKDIVFVLNPELFINAGVDPEKLAGWVFAKVEKMDANGRTVEVDKLLKPFNLR